MNYLILLVVLIVILLLLALIIKHFITLPQKRRNKEIIKQSFLLFEENYSSELAKHNARIIGSFIKERIKEISDHNAQ